MNRFIRIAELFDSSILTVYQKFSNWFQKVFGLTNFFLARVCLMTLCFMYLVFFTIPIIISELFTFITAFLAVFVGMLLFLGFRICKRSERKCINSKNNFLNKNEKTFFKWRLFVVLFFGFRTVVFIQTLATDFNVSMVIMYGMIACHHIIIVHFFYFVSCTPLPPCEGKFKVWLKATKEKLSGVFHPVPDLAITTLTMLLKEK